MTITSNIKLQYLYLLEFYSKSTFIMTKSKSLGLVSIAYILAAIAGISITHYYMADSELLLKSLVADVVATIVVFAFSVKYSNSSFYDPYWSVIPIILVAYWLFYFDNSYADFRNLLIMGLVSWWGLRLTWNWILRWEGMKDEDFRYTDLRAKTGKFYWGVSFAGIHMLPTLIVFLGLIPVLRVFETENNSLNYIDIIALIITSAAILLETTADNQLRKFKRNNTDKSVRLNSGVWKYVKYPNYLGENLFWWGLFIFSLAINIDNWTLVYAPLAMTFLFVFISIPMMKKRLAARKAKS